MTHLQLAMQLAIDAAATQAGSGFPWAFALVYAVGFLAAVVIGSIAWYNSKRPPGWEGRDRPNVIPKVGDEDGASSDGAE